MLFGHASANLLWLGFNGAVLLGSMLVYVVMRAGHLRRGERSSISSSLAV